MTNSTLVSPVKMEYGWNVSNSGLKMMMKSGLGKIFLKFLHALTMLFLLLNLYFWSKFSNKNDMVSAWRNFKNIFPRPLFIIIFRPEILNLDPCSTLTGDTRVEFVIYCVLSIIYPTCKLENGWLFELGTGTYFFHYITRVWKYIPNHFYSAFQKWLNLSKCFDFGRNANKRCQITILRGHP